MKKIEKIDIKRKNELVEITLLCLCVLAVLLVVWAFTGQWPWKSNPYNSYVLQAQSWISGRLDVDNRQWLELAIYKDKYYVSFPPFPSYVMLPFALVSGGHAPDGFISLAFVFIGAAYAYKLARSFGKSELPAMFWAMFIAIGTNILFTSTSAWVWFIAQTMCFAFLAMSLYYAKTGKGGFSFAAWACAVGCRPFSILYIFLILYLLYANLKENHPESGVKELIITHWKWYIAPLAIALSYMALNTARFGNPLEFGHNYLPEFLRTQEGQFSPVYIADNVKKLFRLPSVNDDGTLEFPGAEGFCIFLASPLFISYVIYSVKSLIRREDTDKIGMLIVFVSLIAELLCLTAHRTMGGSHFGNRYPNDTLPLVLTGIMLCRPKNERTDFLNSPLMIMGFALNLVGSVMYYI